MGLLQTHSQKFHKALKWKWGSSTASLWAALPGLHQRKELQEVRGLIYLSQFSLFPSVHMSRTQSRVNILQLWIPCPADPGLELDSHSNPCLAPKPAGITAHTHCGSLIFHGLDKIGTALICTQPEATAIPMGTLRKVILGRNSVCGYWSLAPL